MKKAALAGVVLVLAVLACGCGGSGGGTDTTAGVSTGAATADSAPAKPLPAPDAIAACFRREGAVSVYQKKEHGVRFVNGLIEAAYAVSAELTGDQATTDEFLERYEAEEPSELEAFEVLDGAAVGVVNEKKPGNKKIVITCLEHPSGRAQ